MWVFDVDGFFSVVEFSPPRKQTKAAVYGTKEYTDYRGEVKTATDYQNLITAAEYGTEFVLQEYIDQLGDDYSPATKDFLSSHLLVRARIEEDLKVLEQWDDKIIYFSDNKADYKYRAIMTRRGWAAYLHHMASTIDYSSHVKEEMNRRAPQIPGGRYGAFSKIWNACMAWQDNSWGGYGSYSSGGHYSSGSGSTSYFSKGIDYSKPATPVKSTSGTKYGSHGVHSGTPTWSGVVDKDDEWVEDPEGPGPFSSSFFPNDLPEDTDEPTDIQVQISKTGATFETMRLQLKDILEEMSFEDPEFDLNTAVDALIESFGTCDLDSLREDALLSVVFVDDYTVAR